jgi:hypothetical protein
MPNQLLGVLTAHHGFVSPVHKVEFKAMHFSRAVLPCFFHHKLYVPPSQTPVPKLCHDSRECSLQSSAPFHLTCLYKRQHDCL